MNRSTFLRLRQRVLSLSRRDDVASDQSHFSNVGESSFRSIGDDPLQAAERYGFRAFKVIATTSRKTVKFGGEVHRAPLRLVSHPMNGRLASIYREYLYSPGVNVAACQPYGGPIHPTAPHLLDNNKPHGCGFYAWSATDEPDAQTPVNTYTNNLSTFVQAVVAGSGRRIVGTKGFLSERMRIVAFAFPLDCTLASWATESDRQNAHDLFGPALERLMTAHYPDVAVFDSVERMVHEFPLTPPAKPPVAA